MQSFVISFFTALVVSAGVSAFFHFGLAQREPDPVEALQPVEAAKPDQVEVPNMAGLTAPEARLRLEGVGLRVETATEESDTVPKDGVIGTKPGRFTKVDKGSGVILKISAGVSTVAVPNVRRMHPNKARKALEEAGFVVEMKSIVNEDFAFDRVVRQEPKADEQAKKGSTVVVTVNSEDDY